MSTTPSVVDFTDLEVKNNVLVNNLKINEFNPVTVSAPLKIGNVTLQGDADIPYTLELPSNVGTSSQVLKKNVSGTEWNTFTGLGNLTLDDVVEVPPDRTFLTPGVQTIYGTKTIYSPIYNGVEVNGNFQLNSAINDHNFIHNGDSIQMCTNANKSIRCHNTAEKTYFDFLSNDTVTPGTTYHTRLEFGPGNGTNGSGSVTVYANTFNMKRTSAANVFYVGGVGFTGNATHLNNMAGVVPGIASPSRCVVVDATRSVSGINSITGSSGSEVRINNQVYADGIVGWSLGSQSVVGTNTIYVANTSAAQCTFTLPVAATAGKRYLVIRNDTGTTNKLIIDAATNAVTLQLVASGNLESQVPMDQFLILDTGTSYLLLKS